MAYQGLWQDNLPWSDTEADRKLVGYVFIALAVSTVLFLIVQFLPLMEVEEKELKEVSPRLAKLIIEKQSKPKPPPPVPKPKKEEKPKPEKKAEKKPEPKPKPKAKPKPDKTQVAKKQAQKHITAIQDALADLREFDVASLEANKPTKSASTAKTNTAATTAVIAAKAKQGSGGINTSSLTRATGTGDLKGRQTTAVTSSIQSGSKTQGTRSGGSGKPSRPNEEIELVFQKNKGSIFSLYNRALRKDPTLQGKVVVELTIAPSGQVTKVRIVSSDLKNPELERKLIARIKLFRFKPGNVDTLIVKYPIDFLPT
jgi:protein TonB